MNETCVGFEIACDVLLKGAGVVVTGVVLFIGSVYLMLTLILGRWMGYLLLMVAFSGWMMLLSSLWIFGYWSQGPGTPVNLGPRGAEPAWVVLEAGVESGSQEFPEIESYPGAPWEEPGLALASAKQSVTSAVQDFFAAVVNEEGGMEVHEPGAIQPTDFTVEDVAFATSADGGTPLAAARAFYSGGGPAVTVLLKHDSGSVPRYSWMFLGASVVLFAVHLPLLDRAEARRKEILTGGTAPPWYGPA